MKTIFYAILLIGSASSLNFCKSDQKSNDAANNQVVDSSKTQNVEVVNELAPPDSDYTGDFFKKYDNGIVKARGFFRFGKRHGKWMYFYPNGLMWSEAYFDNDKMDGESNVYHENGKLYYSGFYDHDKPVGTWKFYDTSGIQVNTKVYDSIPQPKK